MTILLTCEHDFKKHKKKSWTKRWNIIRFLTCCIMYIYLFRYFNGGLKHIYNFSYIWVKDVILECCRVHQTLNFSVLGLRKWCIFSGQFRGVGFFQKLSKLFEKIFFSSDSRFDLFLSNKKNPISLSCLWEKVIYRQKVPCKKNALNFWRLLYVVLRERFIFYNLQKREMPLLRERHFFSRENISFWERCLSYERYFSFTLEIYILLERYLFYEIYISFTREMSRLWDIYLLRESFFPRYISLLWKRCLFYDREISFTREIYLLCERCLFYTRDTSRKRKIYLLRKRYLFYERYVSFTREIYLLQERYIFYRRDISFTRDTSFYKKDAFLTRKIYFLRERCLFYEKDVYFMRELSLWRDQSSMSVLRKEE